MIVIDERARRPAGREIAQPEEDRIAAGAHLEQPDESFGAREEGHGQQQPHEVHGSEPLDSEEAGDRREQRKPPRLGSRRDDRDGAPVAARCRKSVDDSRVVRMPGNDPPDGVGQREELQQGIGQQHCEGDEERAWQRGNRGPERAAPSQDKQEGDRPELQQQERQRTIASLVDRRQEQEEHERPKERGARRLHTLVQRTGFDGDQFGLTLFLWLFKVSYKPIPTTTPAAT